MIAMREKEKIPISNYVVESVKVLPSTLGQKVLVASRDKKIYIVDLSQDVTENSSKKVKAYEGHLKRATDAEYSPVGDKILSVGADQRLIFWDRETKERKEFAGHHRTITKVALNAENNKIVTTSEDGSFCLWNTEGKQMAVFDKGMENSHKLWINHCGFIPKSADLFVTASEDGTVKIWDLISSKLLKTFIQGNLIDYEKAKEAKVPVCDFNTDLAVKAISFSKDGSLLAYGGRDGKVYLINLTHNECLQVIPTSDKVTAIASGENQPLIAIAVPNKILLWHIIESKIVGQYDFAKKGEKYVYSLTFMGDELIAGMYDGTVLRIDLSRN